ncbi:MAG: OmpA family protein [Prevotella sp.]|nr:OmpA family protein [Candidatus Prevotella equi]
MKKIITLFAVALMAITAMAQEQGFYGNKFWDNWYVGLNGGLATKTNHQALMKNLNANAGLRVGKLFSPVIGVGVEGMAFFNNRVDASHESEGTAIRYHQLGLYATVNLMNAFKGYYGEPRKFEVYFLPAFYWGHTYGEYNYGARKNTLVNKLAVDLAYNFGRSMEWQVYLEPSINFLIAGMRDDGVYPGTGEGKKLVLYDINNSFLQLSVGVNYKFKTSNGTHNFAIVEACDQIEIDSLNEEVNQLRAKALNDEEKIVSLQKEHDDLEEQLQACEQKPAPVVTKAVSKEPDLPAVFYPLNKSIITPAQQPNVAVAAEVLKNHPEYNLLIKGYASPEGPHDNNTSLGIRRAGAVKTMLVNKYKIDANRITAEGCGETDELFPVFEFNRVAVMFLQKKDK